jgi:hypothetical protein
MRSVKMDSVGDLKEMLYNRHLHKDELSRLGMENLNNRLNDDELREKLQALVEFLRGD